MKLADIIRQLVLLARNTHGEIGWMAVALWEVYKTRVVLLGSSQVLVAPSSSELVHQQPSEGGVCEKWHR
jgi:hypothetical protein